jgi:MinD-like ATPase involved in chromosome partitioning or flagellar assembly
MRKPFTQLHKNERSSTFTILVAAKEPNLAVLHELSKHKEITVLEAFTTKGVLQCLSDCQLIILDELIESDEFSFELLNKTILEKRIPHVSQEGFLFDPNAWIGTMSQSHGSGIHYVPPKQILFTGWTGGVGKTTLALAVCKRFVQKTGLPAIYAELGLGPSAIKGKISENLPSFFDVVTGKDEPGKWENISILPMDYQGFQVLWQEDAQKVQDFILRLQKEYSLVVLDAHPAHPLFSFVNLGEMNYTTIVVSNPREDAVYQARLLYESLLKNKHLVINMARNVVDRMDGGASLILPHKENWANQLDERLADPILNLIYPIWSNR